MVRSNNTKTLEFGAEKGLLQGHARRWVAHALRSTKLLKTFIKALLKAKGEGGTWLTVANFLVVRSFALEVRSWSGNDVPENLYQTSVVLCPDKKGQGSKVWLAPSKAPVLDNRGHSSAASSLRARPPDSAQLSSLRESGAQPNWPSGSSGHPKGRDQAPQSVAQADCHSC